MSIRKIRSANHKIQLKKRKREKLNHKIAARNHQIELHPSESTHYLNGSGGGRSAAHWAVRGGGLLSNTNALFSWRKMKEMSIRKIRTANHKIKLKKRKRE